MKRPRLKQRWLQKRLGKRRRKRERRAAGNRRQRRLLSQATRRRNPEYYQLREVRQRIRREVYRKRKYDDKKEIISVKGELGIEDSQTVEYFLELASTFIDFNSKELLFDLSQCTRVWPSGITLLCSLKEWVELTSKPQRKPKLGSTASQDNRVNSYLAHSGFYDFVQRDKDTDESFYPDHEIVKIQREIRPSNIEDREKEFLRLIKQYSKLTSEEVELFDSKILTEVFANISEHGVTNRDRGWWVLAQHHPKHRLLSLCFADNGIGIRNSLTTGPQREYVRSKVKNEPANDGDFIQLAIEETITGALAAEVPPRRLGGRYVSGARRGNGLKRIRATCQQLAIPFSILSHHGYAFIGNDGKYARVGSKPKRVFAGTLYHFTIPTY